MISRIAKTVANGVETLAKATRNPETLTVPTSIPEKRRREAICGACPVRNGNFCDIERTHPLTGIPGCGCYLPVKQGRLHQHCPSELW